MPLLTLKDYNFSRIASTYQTLRFLNAAHVPYSAIYSVHKFDSLIQVRHILAINTDFNEVNASFDCADSDGTVVEPKSGGWVQRFAEIVQELELGLEIGKVLVFLGWQALVLLGGAG